MKTLTNYAVFRPLPLSTQFAFHANFGVAVPASIAANSRDAAIDAAGRLGYPLAMKTANPAIPHKTEAGGVVLGLEDADAVATAYDAMAATLGPAVLIQQQAPTGTELLVGMVLDAQFGPLMTVGLGGVLVEVFDDTATFLPPVGALSDAVARLSILAALLGDLIAELDVNPIIAHQRGAIAVDALLVPLSDKGET